MWAIIAPLSGGYPGHGAAEVRRWTLFGRVSAAAAKPRPRQAADFTGAGERLWIIGATSMQAITDAVTERLVRDYVMPQPITKLEGTRTGIRAFCAGVGPAIFPTSSPPTIE